jgi:hypothetical protein
MPHLSLLDDAAVPTQATIDIRQTNVVLETSTNQ